VHPHAGHVAAFHEGRRLREAARRRHRGRLHRAPASRWLLLIAAPFLIATVSMLAFVAFILLIAGVVALHAFPVIVLVLIGTAAVKRRRRRRRMALRRGGAAGTAPLPARPAAPPRPDLVWARARERFHRLRGEYAAYECDTMEVLRIPALADVTVASTARFVDAFAEAQALETDQLPPDPHRGGFVAAVDRAERAWRAARDAAERIRLSGLSPAERGTVERVIKLLTTARDSDSDPERHAAYARARAELAKLDRAGVIHLPRTAMAALDAAGRGALPPTVTLDQREWYPTYTRER
jgi:hypothetical protein